MRRRAAAPSAAVHLDPRPRRGVFAGLYRCLIPRAGMRQHLHGEHEEDALLHADDVGGPREPGDHAPFESSKVGRKGALVGREGNARIRRSAPQQRRAWARGAQQWGARRSRALTDGCTEVCGVV